jgi:2-phosphosulfolactate phosphatase
MMFVYQRDERLPSDMAKYCYFPLEQALHAQGIVVVIDVLRAFTTAAFAFQAGASVILPVGTVGEAVNLRQNLPGSVMMGEVEGSKPKEFDYSNSPAAISKIDLSGRTVIQRTSAGTQGIINAGDSQHLFAASFVVASATAARISRLQPDQVSFIITGQSLGRNGDEDRACGEYIADLISGDDPDPRAYAPRVLTSTVGQFFRSNQLDYLTEQDIWLSLETNRFNFYLEVLNENGRLVMRKQKV